jgi:hypothetical protein
MAKQCPSCYKLCGFEPQEPEVNLEISDTDITGDVRCVLTSTCCGDEMKEYSFDVCEDMREAIEAALTAKARELGLLAEGEPAPEWHLDSEDAGIGLLDESAEADDYYEAGKTKKGTPSKSKSRYQTHYYGYAAHATVEVVYPYKDHTLDVQIEHDWKDHVASSEMDEC